MTARTERDRAETVIIGGGIIGLAIAFELAQRGRSVLVLERDRIGSGATWASAGMLAAVAEAEGEDEALVDLSAESRRLYPDFVRSVEETSGQSCGYRREGTLLVALGHDDEADLDHLQAAQRARGLSSSRLTAEEVLEREPQLSGWVTSGLFAPDDHQVDPRAFAQALATAVTTLGGRIQEGVTVEDLVTEGGRLTGVACQSNANEFSVSGDAVVVAAGAWSTVDFPSLDVASRIRPVKGHTVRLKGPQVIRHVIRTPEVYLVPRGDGEVVVGATSEEHGFDPTLAAGAVLDLLRHAWRVLPAIYDMAFIEVSTGFRPAARTHLPLLGALDTSGVFIAAGHGRHGVLLAPVTAKLMGDLIIEGRASDLLARLPAAAREATVS